MVQDSAASRVHHWYSQHSICQINGFPEFHWCLNIKEWCFSKIFTLPKFWQKLSVRRLELTFFLGNFPRSNPHLHLEGPDLHHLHHYPPSSPNLDMKLIPTSIGASTKVDGICGVTFQPRKKSHQNDRHYRHFWKFPDGLLAFFLDNKKLQNPSKQSFKHTFRQKQTAEFHGICIETRKSFLVSFHIFHAKKKNTCHVPYLPKKNLPRTQELKGSRLHFYHWKSVPSFHIMFRLGSLKIQVAVANRYKWNTYLFHQRNGEAQRSQFILVLACQSQEDPRRRHFFAHF